MALFSSLHWHTPSLQGIFRFIPTPLKAFPTVNQKRSQTKSARWLSNPPYQVLFFSGWTPKNGFDALLVFLQNPHIGLPTPKQPDEPSVHPSGRHQQRHELQRPLGLQPQVLAEPSARLQGGRAPEAAAEAFFSFFRPKVWAKFGLDNGRFVQSVGKIGLCIGGEYHEH